MATRLSRTNTTPTLSTKCTFSAWIKRTDTGLAASSRDGVMIEAYTDGNNYAWVRFDGADEIQVYARNSSGNVLAGQSTRKFRDNNAWYHIVMVADSTESTSSDRLKLYINGELETFAGTSTYPSGDVLFNISGATFCIGDSLKQTSNHKFDGQYSHVHFIDGAAYQASTFGSTDSTTGEWKINTSPTIAEYGANGFFMFKDDASLNDDSGKGNNFTVAAGSIQKTEDNPSNSFATINRLNPNAGENILFSGGNTSIDSTGGAHRNAPATIYLPLGNGKFYWEMKVDRMSTHIKVGLVYDEWSKLNKPTPGEEFSGSNEGYAYRNDGQKENNGLTSYGNSYTVGDIIGIAFDTENSNLYFAKNGTWQDSGDPTSGSTGTGKAFTVASGYVYAPIVNLYDADVSFNFGNGFFGTTAISSEGTNASGEGKFEYDVPSGYTALCTKGLNL